MPEVVELSGSLVDSVGKRLSVTIPELFRGFAGGYDYHDADERARPDGKTPTVAFTVLSGSARGGGTIQLYRYANWLTDLGVDVAVYSNDPHEPTWAGLRCRYVYVADSMTRYRQITEDIVVVYSILELPALLQAANRSKQRVLHFCQGLEEFHYGDSFSETLRPKPIFQVLNALPVGRIVVSPALVRYWDDYYRQRAFFIPNGVDPVFYRGEGEPLPEPRFGEGRRPLKILQVANPGHRLKGAQCILEAAGFLALRYGGRNLNVHVTFLSGPNPRDPFMQSTLPAAVSYSIKTGLSAEGVRAEYRAADVVVNAAFHEGFGMSSIEAIASGACLIHADNFGLEDVIENMQHAIVVRRNSVSELVAALSMLVEKPALRRHLQMGGKSIANRFSLYRQYEGFREVFTRLLGAPLASRSEPIAGTRTLLTGADLGAQPTIEVRESPKFSVLVPVYNHARFLPTTLDTLRAQTYPHWEAVVVNDGSTDHTAEVMAEYARRDQRFKLVHKQNGGTASALNAALDGASKEWVCWLSSDDLFKPTKLETHARFIEALPDIKFFHTCYSVLDDANGVERDPNPDTHMYSVPPAFQTLEMCRWNYVHGNTVAVHRSIFDLVGRFDPNYPNAQDFDMWLRMSVATSFHLIKEISCTTRMHAATGTAQFPAAGIFDSYRSLIAFVNERPIADLTRCALEGSVEAAITKICLISINAGAFLYRGTTGRRSPLLEKLYAEATDESTPKNMRETILDTVRSFVRVGLNTTRTSAVIRDHFAPFTRPVTAPKPYQRIDPFVEFLGLYEVGLKSRDAEVVTTLRRYFQKLKRHGLAEVPEIDDIFGLPEQHGLRATV